MTAPNAQAIIDALVAYQTEHNRVVRENDEVRKVNEHLRQLSLDNTMLRLNDVITEQIQAVGATSGIAKAADIRRRQLAKYSLQHDREHSPWEFANAAIALLHNDISHWPWNADGFYRIMAKGDRHRLAHAAALCAAEYDARADE